MKILFVAPYVPSLLRTRSYSWVRHLAEEHRVTVVAPVFGGRDLADLETLRGCCERVVGIPVPKTRRLASYLLALARRDPVQTADCDTPEMRAAIAREAARDYDVAHLEHLRTARLVAALPRHLPRVWDAVDSISLLFRQTAQLGPTLLWRCIARLELPRTRRFEARIPYEFHRVLVTSSRDLTAFQAAVSSESPSFQVLPNGVDLEYFHPSSGDRDPETILVTGKMSYHANISAVQYLARQVMPIVWQSRPMARLVVAGANPPSSLRALAADARVHVTGFVADMRPFLTRASVSVCPTVYGAGIQNKALEAMATSTPLVASPACAAGIAAHPGRDYLLAKTPGEMAAAIVGLLEHPELAHEIGAAGRHYVECHHDWRSLTKRLASEYECAQAALCVTKGGRQ